MTRSERLRLRQELFREVGYPKPISVRVDRRGIVHRGSGIVEFYTKTNTQNQ